MIRRGEIDHALVVAGLLWWLADERPGNASGLPGVEPDRRHFEWMGGSAPLQSRRIAGRIMENRASH